MNPMALLLALLASVGAVGALSGGRSRNTDRDDDTDDDDDGASGGGGSNGGGSNGGRGGNGDGTSEVPDYQVTLPKPPVQTGGTGTDGGTVAPTPITGEKVSLMTGRVATLAPPTEDVASIRIVTQPKAGHVSVNPDKTIAVVLTDTVETGPMSFSYEVTHANGTKSLHTTPLNVTPGLQDDGWGTSDTHYMLETDANDRIVVEHGDNHRAVYISNSDKALTLAEIAKIEGLSVDKITGSWLAAHPKYGSSPDFALAPDAGMPLWVTISPRQSETSNHLLFERGYSYDNLKSVYNSQFVVRGASGESEIHPLYIGAWGEGAKPVMEQYQMIFQNISSNLVIQDLHFTGGLTLLDGKNIIFDNVTFTKNGLGIQDSFGVTVRNSEFYDIYIENPVNSTTTWNPSWNKCQGLFVGNVDGVLLEKNFFDMIAWEKDYRSDGSVQGGMPPNMFNHNMYLDQNNTDLTLRDTISMRASSWGAQVRSGGFIEDNLFLDNNAGFSFLGGMFGGQGPTGNYSLVTDNLTTSAGYKIAPEIGALDWGMTNSGYLSSVVDNIIAHMKDPNNPAELALKKNLGSPTPNAREAFYDDTIIWNWGKPENIDGLDTNVLNQTTIQRFTAQLLNKPDASINDLATYLRAQAGGAYDKVVDADLIIRFFQSGFGIAPDIRTETGMIRFIPDELGEGTRWDNRLNWSTEDLPGSVKGDSVDLGGNKVIFGGNVTIGEMEFGPNGGLRLEHGKLTVAGGMETGKDPATLDVNGAGQIWTEGGRGVGKLDIDVTGGRFANTGDFQMNSDLTASGGQTLLGVDSATYAITKGSRLEVVGNKAQVGFDGEQNGIAILGLGKEGTLAFTADNGKLGSIEEFRSGAFDGAPKVMSGADLGGGKLQLDLTELVDATGTFTLVNVDELIGSFGSTNITGLGGRNAEIVIDYQTDSIMLKLAAGAGEVKTTFVGNQGAFDAGEAALMNALTAGRGTYDNADQAQDDEDYLYAAA
jgi:hypothetical protein